MNQATTQRLALAQRLAPIYEQYPHLSAIAVAGAVARGWADHYSDLELHLFWTQLPAEAERESTALRAEGDCLKLWAGEADKRSECYYIDGVKIEVSHFLVETMEGYLDDVLHQADTCAAKQVLLAAIQYALPLYGLELIESWQNRVAAYPAPLARAMVDRHLQFQLTWADQERLAERDDLLFLYDLYCQLEQQIIGLLLGLNRLYLPHRQGKWLEQLIAEMALAPVDLTVRLKHVFRLAPRSGLRLLKDLVEETLRLVEQHMPEVDVTGAREALQSCGEADQ